MVCVCSELKGSEVHGGQGCVLQGLVWALGLKGGGVEGFKDLGLSLRGSTQGFGRGLWRSEV